VLRYRPVETQRFCSPGPLIAVEWTDDPTKERAFMPTKGFVILTLAFRQEGKVWTGECLELGTATFARTFPQVKKELIELVELHLNELETVGERENFFKKHKIKLYSDQIPEKVSPEIPSDESTLIQSHRVRVGELV